MDDPSKNDRDFFRIATWATVFAMTIVGGFLGSITGRGLEFTLGFSIWTVNAAVIGGVLGWAIWRIARAKAEQAAQKHQNSRRDVTQSGNQRHSS